MPCTHPARHPGTRRDPLATRRGDVLLQRRGCQWLVWEPATNSALRTEGLLPADARAEFILLLQAVPRDRIHHPWLGLAGWFAVDGCGRNLEHQKHWEKEGKEPKIGEVWIPSCS